MNLKQQKIILLKLNQEHDKLKNIYVPITFRPLTNMVDEYYSFINEFLISMFFEINGFVLNKDNMKFIFNKEKHVSSREIVEFIYDYIITKIK